MSFKQTPEYIQSINMQPACNRVLADVFGVNSSHITRFESGDALFVLDQNFHIDVILKLLNGSTLTGQEKTLSHKFYKYRTFTMEFYQNRYTKEKGEFFKIASQFYLHGYSDQTGKKFIEWYIFDILRMLDWLKDYGEQKLAQKTRPAGGSRASFLPIPYAKIPPEFILASSNRKMQQVLKLP